MAVKHKDLSGDDLHPIARFRQVGDPSSPTIGDWWEKTNAGGTAIVSLLHYDGAKWQIIY